MSKYELSKRQKQISELSSKGLSNNEIARRLKISKQAVSQAMKFIRKKEEIILENKIINIAKENMLTSQVDYEIKEIEEFKKYEDMAISELVEKMLKRQMMANIVFHEKAINNADPLYLKAIADHSKTLNDFIIAYHKIEGEK